MSGAKVVVPHERRLKHGDSRDTRSSQWQNDVPQDLHGARAIDSGCILQLTRNSPKERRQHHGRKRHASRDLQRDQSFKRIQQSERAKHDEEWHQDDLARNHQWHQNRETELLLMGNVGMLAVTSVMAFISAPWTEEHRAVCVFRARCENTREVVIQLTRHRARQR